MPRTRQEMVTDARTAARVVEDASDPLRFEQIRNRLHDRGRTLSVKQARRTLDLAEELGLVGRVNRSRWGRLGATPPPAQPRRSRSDAVIDAAARLLELPASTEVNRAVRAVLRLATERGARPVLSHKARREAPAPAQPTAVPAVPASALPERKVNGAHHATDPIEVLLDAHPGAGR